MLRPGGGHHGLRRRLSLSARAGAKPFWATQAAKRCPVGRPSGYTLEHNPLGPHPVGPVNRRSSFNPAGAAEGFLRPDEVSYGFVRASLP